MNHTARVSGAECSLLDLVAGASATGVEVAVACPAGPLAEQLGARDVTWHELPAVELGAKIRPGTAARGLVASARAAAALRAVARAYDLVHANSVRAGIVASLGRCDPFSVHVRDCLPSSPPGRLAARIIARRASRLVANSGYTARHTGRLAGRCDLAIEVVPGPLDLEPFDRVRRAEDRESARRSLGIEPGAPVIGVVGQISPWKGQDRAIRCLARVREADPDATLLVVGSPRFTGATTRYDNLAYQQGLHREVARLRLSGHVRFLGQRADTPQLMRAMDVLLVPSDEEPFGRVVAEGMAAGCAVVATSVGGPAEIISDGTDGLLIAPGDEDGWAEAVTGLIADPERRDRITSGAGGVASRFSVESSFEQLRRLWAAA